jgi:hypothetical protein
MKLDDLGDGNRRGKEPKKIFGLQVAVGDTELVEVGDSREDLLDNVDSVLLAVVALVDDAVEKLAAVDAGKRSERAKKPPLGVSNETKNTKRTR